MVGGGGMQIGGGHGGIQVPGKEMVGGVLGEKKKREWGSKKESKK